MKRTAAGLLIALVCGAAFARVAPHFPPARDISDCRFASVESTKRLIALGVMEGDTLTNLQLGDPDQASTVIRVDVAAGTAPLTIYLESQNAVIWDFEGAVEQIDRVFIVARNESRGVAARGLPKEKVEFPDLARCPWVIGTPSITPREDRNNVDRYFGRSADRLAFEGWPHSVELPTGQFVVPEREAPRKSDAEFELHMYHRGGFRTIDAKSLVSPVPVLEPETYPKEAGLIQLLNDGAIRPPKRSEIKQLIEGFRRQYPSRGELVEHTNFSVDYVITRDMMLPPGLHSKRFLVLPGVAAPRGHIGHACVIFFDGYRSDGPSCGGILRECSPTEIVNPELQRSCRLPTDGKAQ
ncbi:hypothetical protein ACQR1W_27210 [Bradyrhizobium sp. HKCCYLS1011]|uniref:hypothetical protein n=1 Tax=Bradyrhizobium sp. HKCCYLS1011 TaxID=3420733 RepID=UPI003EBB539F